MTWIVRNLWLIPALPGLAAGLSALAKQRNRRFAASLAIGSMGLSFLLSLCAFAHVLRSGGQGKTATQVFNFPWLQYGGEWLKLGWMLDPLTAVMLVMVTFVGLLIFIYSTGYMSHDENFTRFFCFLSLFAAAMLGVVIANSLLLLFMSWELVGLTSYLLIGFWYQKPSAAAAAKKAFLTTRIGDVFFRLGIDGGVEAWWLVGDTERIGTHCGRRDRFADLCRGGREERSASASCVAARCNGGPDSGIGVNSRGDNGGCGRISYRTCVPADAGWRVGWRHNGGPDSRNLGWRNNGGLRSAHCGRPERHQAHSGLLDHLATGLHDGRPGDGRSSRRHVPPDHACVLQGASLHGRRLGDSWLPRGAGHSPHGRLEDRDALDLH